MTPNQQLAADVMFGRVFPASARDDIVRELTPHTLTAEQGAAIRTGFDLALRTRFEEAHIAVCDLPLEALREAVMAVEIFASSLRFELTGRTFDRSVATP